MISIDEIHPGNWFIDKSDNNYCIISEVGLNIKAEKFNNKIYQPFLSNLNPIQITRDIISLAQFQIDDRLYKKALLSGESCLGAFTGQNKFSIWKGFFSTKKTVQFTHQLQNEFYSLTGEELEINLFGIKA
jgi:hypothetical protein